MFRTLLEKLIGLFQKDYGTEEPVTKIEQKVKSDAETLDNDWAKEENQMPEYKGDGKECPFCKSTHVRTILYGYRASPPTEEEAKVYAFGGCCIDPWSPKYMCDACDKRFGIVI